MAGKSGVILNRTCIPKDRVHSVALICGDMGRFMMFKEHATHYREFGQYLCWKAAEIEVDGEMLLIACHGVGSQPAAVLIKELIELGVKCIIRSGTSGTYMPREHGIGDICIVYGAVRGDTISLNEVDAAYPAVADPDVVEALRESSKELNVSTHMGIAYTTDLFYRTGILGEDPRIPLIKAGVAIEETENATLFTLCSLNNVKCGAMCTIDGCPFEWNIGNYGAHDEVMKRGKEAMVKVAVHAAARLSREIKGAA